MTLYSKNYISIIEILIFTIEIFHEMGEILELLLELTDFLMEISVRTLI